MVEHLEISIGSINFIENYGHIPKIDYFLFYLPETLVQAALLSEEASTGT